MPGSSATAPRRFRLSGLDLQTMADTLPTAEIAVRAGVDSLEVGHRSFLAKGCTPSPRFTEKYPNHPIIADLKKSMQATSKPR